MSRFRTVPALVCELSSSVSQQAADSRCGWMSALGGLLSYDNLVHAVAGATGSVIAMSVFFPLDTARTRLQVDDQRKAKHSHEILREIAAEEGFLAWYRGLLPVVSSLCCSNFVYFYSYSGLKALCLADGSKGEPAKELLLAFVAGVVNVLVTTPLWVVNTRLKLQGAHFRTAQYKKAKHPPYAGFLDAIKKIIRDEGVSTLWNGTASSLVLASNPAVVFMVYETVKRYFQRLFRQSELSGLMYFLIGAIAKATATIVTYPLQVIQSRRRVLLVNHQIKFEDQPERAGEGQAQLAGEGERLGDAGALQDVVVYQGSVGAPTITFGAQAGRSGYKINSACQWIVNKVRPILGLLKVQWGN